MSKKLIIPTEIANSITQFYDNKTYENMMVLIIKKASNYFHVTTTAIPSEDDYNILSKESVSLNPSYLLKVIQTCIDEGYDGFILMHNHINGIALFSHDDRITNKKLFNFFMTNKIPLIVGSAVYSNHRVSYTTNNKSIKCGLNVNIYKLGAQA